MDTTRIATLHSSADISWSPTFVTPVAHQLLGHRVPFETAFLEKGGGLELYGFHSLSDTSINLIYVQPSVVSHLISRRMGFVPQDETLSRVVRLFEENEKRASGRKQRFDEVDALRPSTASYAALLKIQHSDAPLYTRHPVTGDITEHPPPFKLLPSFALSAHPAVALIHSVSTIFARCCQTSSTSLSTAIIRCYEVASDPFGRRHLPAGKRPPSFEEVSRKRKRKDSAADFARNVRLCRHSSQAQRHGAGGFITHSPCRKLSTSSPSNLPSRVLKELSSVTSHRRRLSRSVTCWRQPRMQRPAYVARSMPRIADAGKARASFSTQLLFADQRSCQEEVDLTAEVVPFDASLSQVASDSGPVRKDFSISSSLDAYPVPPSPSCTFSSSSPSTPALTDCSSIISAFSSSARSSARRSSFPASERSTDWEDSSDMSEAPRTPPELLPTLASSRSVGSLLCGHGLEDDGTTQISPHFVAEADVWSRVYPVK